MYSTYQEHHEFPSYRNIPLGHSATYTHVHLYINIIAAVSIHVHVHASHPLRGSEVSVDSIGSIEESITVISQYTICHLYIHVHTIYSTCTRKAESIIVTSKS